MDTKITLESIDKKIDAVFGAFVKLDKKIDDGYLALDKKIDLLDNKVEIYRSATINRFDSVDERFNVMDGRFDSLENRFDEVIRFLKNATVTIRENPFSGLIDLG